MPLLPCSYQSAHFVALLHLPEAMVVELLNSALSAKDMRVYLHLKTLFLCPVLGARIIIGTYLTFERALDSFSKL